MTDKLLTADELFSSKGKRGRVPYTRQHGARLEERGEFPRRRQLGPGRVAWSESEIDEWIASRRRGPGTFRGRSIHDLREQQLTESAQPMRRRREVAP